MKIVILAVVVGGFGYALDGVKLLGKPFPILNNALTARR